MPHEAKSDCSFLHVSPARNRQSAEVAAAQNSGRIGEEGQMANKSQSGKAQSVKVVEADSFD
jgi:hypothetical protein